MRAPRILIALWRLYPKTFIATSFVTGVALVAIALFGVSAVSTCSLGCSGAAEVADSGQSRLLLDRAWFDELPDEPTDEITVWVWLASGIGLIQEGSAFRGRFDIFEFVRNGNEIETSFLHDGAASRTHFEVQRCSSNPPMDLCLTLDDPVRGPNRFYAFSDESDYPASHEDVAARIAAAEAAAYAQAR